MRKDSLKHVRHRQERARSQLARKRSAQEVLALFRSVHPDMWKACLASGRVAANIVRAKQRRPRRTIRRPAYRAKTGWREFIEAFSVTWGNK